MLRCSATRAMTRTLHEPWPRPKRPPSARDPPGQSAAPPENRRVNQPETVSSAPLQHAPHLGRGPSAASRGWDAALVEARRELAQVRRALRPKVSDDGPEVYRPLSGLLRAP